MHNRCELCERTLIAGTTAHHLIPRRCHRVRWFRARFTREELQQTVPLCRDCHSAVHEFVSDEKELGKHYATVDALRAHPAIARFLTWVRKQR
ncbi:MAG: hypothetical protein KDC95_07185 [Planctomycetes bacterium]|nr:hypothetical protein [Planctomycetota bacterium]